VTGAPLTIEQKITCTLKKVKKHSDRVRQSWQEIGECLRMVIQVELFVRFNLYLILCKVFGSRRINFTTIKNQRIND